MPKGIGISMKIAQIPPLYEAVPPKLYGGTERIVAHLSNALVELGHPGNACVTRRGGLLIIERRELPRNFAGSGHSLSPARYNHSRLLPIVTTISSTCHCELGRGRRAATGASRPCSSREECRAGEPASGTSP